MFRAGFAPHGIRGAFNVFEDQVAIVARLETFMCTDPPRRASRLRFLVFTGFQRRSASFTPELHRIISTFVCNTTCSTPSATTLTWTLTSRRMGSTYGTSFVHSNAMWGISLRSESQQFSGLFLKLVVAFQDQRGIPGKKDNATSSTIPYFDLFVDLC